MSTNKERRRGKGQVTWVSEWSCHSIHWDGMCRKNWRSRGAEDTEFSVRHVDIRVLEGCTDRYVAGNCTKPIQSLEEISIIWEALACGVSLKCDIAWSPAGSVGKVDANRMHNEDTTFLPKAWGEAKEMGRQPGENDVTDQGRGDFEKHLLCCRHYARHCGDSPEELVSSIEKACAYLITIQDRKWHCL